MSVICASPFADLFDIHYFIKLFIIFQKKFLYVFEMSLFINLKDTAKTNMNKYLFVFIYFHQVINQSLYYAHKHITLVSVILSFLNHDK